MEKQSSKYAFQNINVWTPNGINPRRQLIVENGIIAAIEAILGLFEKASDGSQGTVGYSLNADPIIKADLLEKVRAASERVKAGNYISQEEMEKELENW